MSPPDCAAAVASEARLAAARALLAEALTLAASSSVVAAVSSRLEALFLGPLRQIVGARRDFLGGRVDALRGDRDLADDARERADELVDALAEGGVLGVEIVKGDPAGQVLGLGGFDDRADFGDRELHLLFVFLAGRDVGGVFHDFHGRAHRVEDRVVARLQPDDLAALADAAIAALLILPAPQFLPELAIGRAGAILLVNEDAMMAPDDLLERISRRSEEIGVGVQDLAREIELDDRLGLVEGRELALHIGDLRLVRGDVGGEFHHLADAATRVDDRRVDGLQPNALAALADPQELRLDRLAGRESRPEALIVRAVALARFDEDRVMLALDLGQRVADGLEKQVVGADDLARRVEFDDRLGTPDGNGFCGQCARVHEIANRHRVFLPAGVSPRRRNFCHEF